MSKFKTTIPVNVDAVKAMLPWASFIHGVEFHDAPPRVELTWENDALKTPFTFPLEFSVTRLEAQQLPKDVKLVGAEVARGTATEKPVAKPVPVADTVTQTNESATRNPAAAPGDQAGPAKPKRAPKPAAAG